MVHLNFSIVLLLGGGDTAHGGGFLSKIAETKKHKVIRFDSNNTIDYY